MGGSEVGDDDTLIVSNRDTEKEREPRDTALRQQRIRAWNPVLDTKWVAITMICIGIIFVPVGFTINSKVDDLAEYEIIYDSHDNPDPECGIGEVALANKNCTLEFTVDRDLEPPIFVHYRVEGFNQNQRAYAISRDDIQLLGETIRSSEEDCDPLREISGTAINPCGLIANTLFCDTFDLQPVNDANGETLVMHETGIAWQSDLDWKFKQPDGFYFEECDSCNNCSCAGDEWSCKEPYEAPNGTCYRFFYPEDDTTQYLYETYPMVTNPIEGVTNEHFIVWMRVAALPDFRKMYGHFNQSIAKGTKLVFDVNLNWEVTSWRGSKALIISTSYIFGGKNHSLGRFYYIVGFISIGLGVFFLLKQMFRPRKLADKEYLMYKED